MEHFDKSSENCLKCEELRSENYFFCEDHSNPHDDISDEPILALIYAEDKIHGVFTKYEVNNFQNKPVLFKSENTFSYNYILNCMSPNTSIKEVSTSTRKKKVTQDFKTNFQSMQNENPTKLMDILLQLITSENWRNTTFICQDENSLTYVSGFVKPITLRYPLAIRIKIAVLTRRRYFMS